jgi:hypothetical protein
MVFFHPCEADGCTEDGIFGFGCAPTSLGRWFCGAHKHLGVLGA